MGKAPEKKGLRKCRALFVDVAESVIWNEGRAQHVSCFSPYWKQVFSGMASKANNPSHPIFLEIEVGVGRL